MVCLETPQTKVLGLSGLPGVYNSAAVSDFTEVANLTLPTSQKMYFSCSLSYTQLSGVQARVFTEDPYAECISNAVGPISSPAAWRSISVQCWIEELLWDSFGLVFFVGFVWVFFTVICLPLPSFTAPSASNSSVKISQIIILGRKKRPSNSQINKK